MNVSKSPLRRVSALVAGSLIGLAGVAVFAAPAQAHHGVVGGSSSCDQVTGEWVVKWVVDTYGSQKGNQVKFTKVEKTSDTPIDGGEIVENGPWQQSNKQLTGTQRVAGSAKSAGLKLTILWNNEYSAEASGSVPLEGECTPPKQETPSTSPSPSPSESTPETEEPPVSIPEEVPAKPIFEETCDTITIGVDNTDNKTPFTVDYKTSKGETRKLVVEAGKKGSETFSANKGFKVDVTFTVEYKGKIYSESGTIAWTEPKDCDDAGQGGGLPVTGAAAGGVAAGAAGLLAIGGALFFVARRRKVKFTA
ncbi:hypothetical protein Aph02nite_92490 [Actinoplanes philippinensis]|uniref:LPXTG-motif cell wall anchor domain-containing protein n=1 Tax=Actinoplanes philippinensis TaxID=35752 RepID=A0A1I2MUR3_9ACTN|nr:LPXTG cell wall anchor domain-containing protein [Actinoplanes philippinensis]GIE83299.1 hypothetical protein Aph02nite_92490 [Actinoplanes philippinensis]SFF95163.1 LPXTG-motif cell wall anchor domain-containing protein [Actinoplanes philippinensis]